MRKHLPRDHRIRELPKASTHELLVGYGYRAPRRRHQRTTLSPRTSLDKVILGICAGAAAFGVGYGAAKLFDHVDIDLEQSLDPFVSAFCSNAYAQHYGGWARPSGVGDAEESEEDILEDLFPAEFVRRHRTDLGAIENHAGECARAALENLERGRFEADPTFYRVVAAYAKQYTSRAYFQLNVMPADFVTGHRVELIRIASSAGESTPEAYHNLPREFFRQFPEQFVRIAQAAGTNTGDAYRVLSELPARPDELENMRDLIRASGEHLSDVLDALPVSLFARFPDHIASLTTIARGNIKEVFESIPEDLFMRFPDEFLEVALNNREAVPAAYAALSNADEAIRQHPGFLRNVINKAAGYEPQVFDLHEWSNFNEIVDAFNTLDYFPGSILADKHLESEEWLENIRRVNEENYRTLCERCYVSQFQRYSDGILRTVQNNINGQRDETKPDALFIVDKSDHNDAYELLSLWNKELRKFSRNYNIYLYEADASEDYEHAIRDLGTMLGQKGIDVVVFGGHGETDSVGSLEAEYVQNNFAALAQFLADDVTLIFEGCENGQGRDRQSNIPTVMLNTLQKGTVYAQMNSLAPSSIMHNGRFSTVDALDGGTYIARFEGGAVVPQDESSWYARAMIDDRFTLSFADELWPNWMYRVTGGYDWEEDEAHFGGELGYNILGLGYLSVSLDRDRRMLGAPEFGVRLGFALPARPEIAHRNYEFAPVFYTRWGIDGYGQDSRTFGNVGLLLSMGNLFGSPLSVDGRADFRFAGVGELSDARKALDANVHMELSDVLGVQVGYSWRDFVSTRNGLTTHMTQQLLRGAVELHIDPTLTLRVQGVYRVREDDFVIGIELNANSMYALISQLFE